MKLFIIRDRIEWSSIWRLFRHSSINDSGEMAIWKLVHLFGPPCIEKGNNSPQGWGWKKKIPFWTKNPRTLPMDVFGNTDEKFSPPLMSGPPYFHKNGVYIRMKHRVASTTRTEDRRPLRTGMRYMGTVPCDMVYRSHFCSYWNIPPFPWILYLIRMLQRVGNFEEYLEIFACSM